MRCCEHSSSGGDIHNACKKQKQKRVFTEEQMVEAMKLYLEHDLSRPGDLSVNPNVRRGRFVKWARYNLRWFESTHDSMVSRDKKSRAEKGEGPLSTNNYMGFKWISSHCGWNVDMKKFCADRGISMGSDELREAQEEAGRQWKETDPAGFMRDKKTKKRWRKEQAKERRNKKKKDGCSSSDAVRAW